jgi:hypothetical protein
MLRPVRVIEEKHFAHDDGHSWGVFASLRVRPNSSRDLLLLRWEASALFEFHVEFRGCVASVIDRRSPARAHRAPEAAASCGCGLGPRSLVAARSAAAAEGAEARRCLQLRTAVVVWCLCAAPIVRR